MPAASQPILRQRRNVVLLALAQALFVGAQFLGPIRQLLLA